MLWEIGPTGYYQNEKGKYQHRVIYKLAYGVIPFDWVIHHIDQVKINNSLDNLIALPTNFHHRLHKKMRDDGITYPREFIQKLLDIYLNGLKNEKPNKKKSKYKTKLQKSSIKASKIRNAEVIADLHKRSQDFKKQLKKKRKLFNKARSITRQR